jgi:hypothetical protein
LEPVAAGGLAVAGHVMEGGAEWGWWSVGKGLL